jgi:hypothetical protein
VIEVHSSTPSHLHYVCSIPLAHQCLHNIHLLFSNLILAHVLESIVKVAHANGTLVFLIEVNFIAVCLLALKGQLQLKGRDLPPVCQLTNLRWVLCQV